jgi:hypothetical protein
MQVFTLPVVPITISRLGSYLGSYYTPTVAVVSNATPLFLSNNPSGSSLSFSTLGVSGGTYAFVIIYPKNITLQPFSLMVDGVPTSASSRTNSTHFFTFFTVPSGNHNFSLGYFPPTSTYGIQYPKFYPGAGTVAAVLIIAAAGIASLFLYLWRRGRTRAPAT